jgi:hypothetical protein
MQMHIVNQGGDQHFQLLGLLVPPLEGQQVVAEGLL